MSILLPAALTGSAVAVLLARGQPERRLQEVAGRSKQPAAGGSTPGRSGAASGPDVRAAGDGPAASKGRSLGGLGPRAACATAGLAVGLLVGGLAGLLLGLVLAVTGPRVLARLEPQADRRAREQLVEDLPLALDLLAACLTGGASVPAALRAVASAVPGPCGRCLGSVAAALAVGTPSPDAWAALGREHEELTSLARALARAGEGGAAVAATVTRLAADQRSEATARGVRAAKRAGVLAVAPLGLCFLPAFLLVGVVPVVVGLVGPILSGL